MNRNNLSQRLVLGIETSCDETSVSLLEANFNENGIQDYVVHAHLVHSQFEIHSPFGGVVPEVAARDHLAKLPDLVSQAFEISGKKTSDLTEVAATAGPGLIGAVMVGYLFAQGVAEAAQIPLRAINHVDAHLAPATLCSEFSVTDSLGKLLKPRNALFPRLSLTVSGGHCLLALDESHSKRNILGTTLDDACGEAFDKVAKLLNLGSPGGPAIEKRALLGNPNRFPFSRPLQKSDDLSFSFSGLKTAVLRVFEERGTQLCEADIHDLCASFQEKALGHLVDRLAKAEKQYVDDVQEIVIAGGVAANLRFRQLVSEKMKKPTVFAPKQLCNDNATMIAMQALLHYAEGKETAPFARYTYAQDFPNRSSAQKLKGNRKKNG